MFRHSEVGDELGKFGHVVSNLVTNFTTRLGTTLRTSLRFRELMADLENWMSLFRDKLGKIVPYNKISLRYLKLGVYLFCVLTANKSESEKRSAVYSSITSSYARTVSKK